jgi:hypothetical protein
VALAAWYAKLWWSAIPVWWLGMATTARVDVLAAFYGGALAGYLNVLFFPMTALMVLGVGYVRSVWTDRGQAMERRCPMKRHRTPQGAFGKTMTGR